MPEIEIKGRPWEKGKCGIWHKTCKEARDDCNLWIELPVTVRGPLGVPVHGTAHACTLFAIMEIAKRPIVVNAQASDAPPSGLFRGSS